MNIAEPDLQVAARREEIVRLEELTARARAQTAFSSAVIARVVSDLESRRRALVASIEAEVPSLRARCAELCAREASYARRAEEIGFQIDEIALRAAIGEIEGGGEGVLQAERAQAEHALSEARSERLYLEDLLSRCAPRRDDPAPAPPDEDIEILEAEPDEEDPWSLREVSAADLPVAPPASEPERAWITLSEGDRDERAVEVGEPGLTIGRGNRNDLQLRGDGKVSRRHLSVFRADGLWWLEDHHSANGTLVNGELVTGRRRLYGGEEIIVGETFLRFSHHG